MWVKICGMSEQVAVSHAAALGVDLCGFVFYPPSPRCISPEQAALLDTGRMKRVGVFVRQNVDDVLRAADTARLDFVQLHGGQDSAFAAALPAERVIRVLWPQKYSSLEELQKDLDRFAPTCALYLLDAGMGSGRALDWRALHGLRFPHHWLLSGGLGPNNLQQALSVCSPDGVDLNSCLEDVPGHKSLELMNAAVAAVQARETQ